MGYPPEIVGRGRQRCQELLDRASLANPDCLLIACMGADGKVIVSKISHDPGVESLLLVALTVAVQESIKKLLSFQPLTDPPGPDQIPPSNPN